VSPQQPSRAGGDGAAPERRLPIASLVKSLRVLEELALAGGSSSVATLIDRSGLERTTVQRVLRTLHAEGYVERTSRGEYGVAPRGYVLGAMLSKSSHLAVAADPIIRELQRATGETVHVAVLDGTDIVSVAHLPADRMLTFNFPVGTRIPAYASTLGRTILANLPPERGLAVLQRSDRRPLTAKTLTSLRDLRAELERVRQQGFCAAIDEVEIGVASIAAPVFGPTGEALAAINVVVPTAQVTEASGFDALAPDVKAAAATLSRALGWVAETSGSARP
jgi:DNA-binding IclR family transcriptional regulator